MEPKGEAVAFGVFGAIAFTGFLLSLGIRGHKLEAEGLYEEEGTENSNDADENGRR